MAQDKPFRVLGPYPKHSDMSTLSWLCRESAEEKLASEGYEVAEYSEREVPLEEVPPVSLKHLLDLGLNPDDFIWFEFSGVGRVNRPVLDWLIAECKWQSKQLKLWVAAERHWKATNASVV